MPLTQKRKQCSMATLTSDEHSFHFFTWKLQFMLQENLQGLNSWLNMTEADLSLKPFSRWLNLCNIYVHQAGIGGDTTCPYENFTPTSPITLVPIFLYIFHIFLL